MNVLEMSIKTFLLIYIFGGLTFIPLVLLLTLFIAYTTFSKPRLDHVQTSEGSLDAKSGDKTSVEAKEIVEKTKDKPNGTESTAAYFAVCREYVPGGINGKPPERSSPAGEVLQSESPSVYQSMYRSIFDRNKTQVPSFEGDKKDGRPVKRARNIFFVVLRHEHLLLFDSADQLEVRHVISLLHHNIDIYGGGDAIPESELWVKRNCIRLTRKQVLGDPTPTSQPFYLFSDNCPEKEDFYHALLQTQATALDTDPPPRPKIFETAHIIKLVQQLHLSDTDPQIRWLNALIGRLFLAVYKTDELEAAIRAKVNRKISRVSKPNFITSIALQHVDFGDAAPVFSNPRIKENLTVDGTLTLEADVKYNGGFKMQIAAIARIDLGQRIRAREVELVLSGVLRRLSGHVLLKIKPPPSNRLWITFDSMPHMDLRIEPIVSSRQITYGVILRAIESKIREVMGETLVLPNWDDIPFFETSNSRYRGGIWDWPKKEPPEINSEDEGVHEDEHQIPVSINDAESGPHITDPDPISHLKKKTISMPALVDTVMHGHVQHKPRRRFAPPPESETVSSSASPNTGATTTYELSEPPSPSSFTLAEKPKAMRSNSFASAATPVVSVDDAMSSVLRTKPQRWRGQKDAVGMVKEMYTRSDSHLPEEEPAEFFADDKEPHVSQTADSSRRPSTIAASTDESATEPETSPRVLPSATFPVDKTPIAKHSSMVSPSLTNLSGASAKAKNWGWGVLNRQTGHHTTVSPISNTAALRAATMASQHDSGEIRESTDAISTTKPATISHKEPMGRGQPLPPPGTPLPGPAKSLWSTSALNLGGMRRKPIPPTKIPANKSNKSQLAAPPSEIDQSEEPPPLPARRHRHNSAGSASALAMMGDTHAEEVAHPEMMVVAAPAEDEGEEHDAAHVELDEGQEKQILEAEARQEEVEDAVLGPEGAEEAASARRGENEEHEVYRSEHVDSPDPDGANLEIMERIIT